MADQLENESAAALLSFKNGGLGYEGIKQEPEDEMFEAEDTPILGPAALGLQPVGEEQTPRTPTSQPGLVLNRRGMPARIRKKNRLFFDDDVVNAMPPRSSAKRGPRASPTKKAAVGMNSKLLATQIKKHQLQQQLQELEQRPPSNTHQEPPTASTSSTYANANWSADRRAGQRLGMRLRNLLKLPKAHKWVCYEWFYSNIDKPLFEGENDFMICLRESFPHLKTRKLTRVEWCKIRRMMGKPRRCSQSFFEEERRELDRKRTKIRLLQQRKTVDLSTCKDLPPEIPLQLVIGTKVTARLRKPQDGLFTGSIDAVDTSNNTYRITFERGGLGTHSVPDYEVLSNDPPETITLSSFAQKFRPRNLVPFITTPPRYSGALSPRLISDPMLSSSHSTKNKNIPSDGILGGFPVKFLEMIVRLSKILNVKKTKIKKLRDMNTEAEKRKSFGTHIPEDFQRRYASVIIELERLNHDLQEYLTTVQNFCHEIAPEPSVAVMLAPSHLRDSTLDEARTIVNRYNRITCVNPVKSERTLNLITQLTALVLQVKSLAGTDRSAYEVKVLQSSMEQIRAGLSPENLQCFQDSVELRMKHIQMGLGQYDSLHPFMAQRA
ncbi:protein lin-9 homolog isoform X1 [Schistocerca nitens]|uniref:protein lin-9 homolog isoform X1 n=2 Tax=Schistocerca nitens TaxID=7011 RepID=UPI0021199C9C|nr:protein lin-9 homolog isoform X1 [Schistocerca nitens]